MLEKIKAKRRRGCQRIWLAAAAAKSLQLYPTLCDPVDRSPAGSPVPRILQARTLDWVVISFSNAWKWKVKMKSLSRVWLLATPWTAAYQAPPSRGISRQEYWSGPPLPSPGWLDRITDSLDMDLSKRWKRTKNREAWHLAVHGVAKSQTWLSNWTAHGVSGMVPSCWWGFHFSSIEWLGTGWTQLWSHLINNKSKIQKAQPFSI